MRCGSLYLEGDPLSHISVTRTPAGMSIAVTEMGSTSTWKMGKEEAEAFRDALSRAVEGWEL